jgi:site-specific recombinase XerD
MPRRKLVQIIARRDFPRGDTAVNDFNLDALAVIASKGSPVPHPDYQLTIVEALPLDQNPAAVYLATLKKSSRRPQKCALDTVAGILSGDRANCFELDWSRVRYQHTALVRSQLMDGYAPATANRILCALRGTLEESWLLGQMSAEDYHRAAHLSPIIGETLPAGRELSADEILALLQDCANDPRPIGARDAAVIAVMYSGGLRREEVTKLELADYDETNRKLLVHGKRSKERAVYLADGAVTALKDWMNIRGKNPGPIFLAVNKGGNLIGQKRMTTQAIYYLLKSRAKRADVENFSPHDIRRTFVSDLLEAGVDIATVARMAGHSSVDTTARYDRRPEQAKQRAAMLLKVPYG